MRLLLQKVFHTNEKRGIRSAYRAHKDENLIVILPRSLLEITKIAQKTSLLRACCAPPGALILYKIAFLTKIVRQLPKRILYLQLLRVATHQK